MQRLTNIYRCLLFVLVAVSLCLTSCKEQTVSADPNLKLAFSQDTVCFDTVFTGHGSSTKNIMVYNPNANAVVIDHITLKGQWFRLNIDGENDPDRLRNITLNGHDSLYLFVKAKVEEQTTDMPVLVEDTIWFFTNGNRQYIALQAVGINVSMIRSEQRLTTFDGDYTFTSSRPYLIYDTLVINGKARFAAGSTLYMHQGSNLILQGGVSARGTLDKPVRITSDRLDRLFDHVPYQSASGGWGGVYLVQPNGLVHHDTLDYVEILNGNVGLYCSSPFVKTLPTLTLSNSRIHNHATYGVVLQNTDAEIWNTEISNCASFCLFLEGGTHTLTHNTIASYFGWPYTNINIHNVSRRDVPAVYINNLEGAANPTVVTIRNSIVAGARKNNLESAVPLPEDYAGEFYGNYLQTDTLNAAFSRENVYAQDSDRIFINTDYKYKEYVYYDFRLDSLSVALGIGDSLLAQNPKYISDRKGVSRREIKPDAGCYQRLKE